MPFQPPQRSPLVSILLNNLLQQRAQKEDEAARSAERRKQNQYELAQQTAKLGGSKALMGSAALFRDVPTEELHGLGVIGDLQLKREREEKKRAEAMDPAGLQNLAKLAAPIAGPNGQMVPPSAESRALYGAGLEDRARALQDDPLAVTSMAQQAAQYAQALGRGGQETLAAEKRGEAEATRREGREDFRARRDAAIASEANALAYSKQGIVPIDDSLEASAERLVSGGIPRAIAKSAALQAAQRATGIRPVIAERVQSDAGKKESVIKAEDRKADLIANWPSLSQDPDIDRKARMIEAEQMVLDPYSASKGTPVFLTTFGSKDYARVVAQREALVDVDDNITLLESAYGEAVQAQKDPRRRGEFLGGPLQTDSFFDVLAKFGAGPGEVVNVRTAAVRYAFAEAKSTQGARSSDLDFAKNMLYVPAPNEIGTPLGDAKLRQLRQVHNARVNAPMSPETRKKFEKLNSKYRAATGALNSVAAQAAKEIEETGAISSSTQTRLDAEIAKFQRSPAAKQMKRDMEDLGITSEGGATSLSADDEALLGKH